MCTVSSNPSIPPGGRGGGVGGGGRDGGAGWGVEKGMRCTVGALQKAVGRERESTLVLFCNERKERITLGGCVWKWAPYLYPKTEKGIEDSSLHSLFVPWAVSRSVLLLAYLLVFLQG